MVVMVITSTFIFTLWMSPLGTAKSQKTFRWNEEVNGI